MSHTPLVVLFPVFDQFQILDVSGPLQVLSTANDERRLAGQAPLYDCRVGSLAPGLVASSSGLSLAAARLPVRTSSPWHTILIPGGPGVWQAAERQPLVDWLRRASRHTTRLASVCTGAFLLARTGLLDGGHAVTHWAACDAFEQEFPAVSVLRDAIFFREGPLWSSAGVTAGIDMTLAMVEEDAGRDIAMAVAKKLVVFYRRPGGQSQFSSALLEQAVGDPRLEQLHRWITQHLREPLSVERLAAQLAMTPRTFARFYRQQTGTTPARALEKLRLERACALIEGEARSAKAIALACGFSSEEIMRRAFLRHLKVSPSEYRERFSSQTK